MKLSQKFSCFPFCSNDVLGTKKSIKGGHGSFEENKVDVSSTMYDVIPMWMPLEINSFVWKSMKENQEYTSGDYLHVSKMLNPRIQY